MKKIISIAVAALTLCGVLAGCNNANTTADTTTTAAPVANNNSEATDATTTEATDAPVVTNDAKITVISREAGSGTRGAFVELFGVEQKDADGNKVDMTIDTANICENTGLVRTSVSGDINAIGYISLGSLDDSVKALQIEGVEATVENIKNGSYIASRPFNIATKEGLSELGQDFVNYILSTDGQAIVEEKGYIAIDGATAFTSTNPTGSIVVGGSSSVSPVMEKLIEGYKAINANADITLQQSDSSNGMQGVADGIFEIGMASRELKESELANGLTPTVIAIDGIAVIVNKDNALENLTKDQVMGIYTGTATKWSDIK